MKRILQIVSTLAVVLSMSGAVASAASVTCGDISGANNGGTNVVSCTDVNLNSVSCVNNVVVLNANGQGASSGNASSSNNATSGNATSGSASNTNSTKVNVGASCAPVAGSTTSFTTAPAASVGKGAGSTTPALTSAAALPETGSSTAKVVAIVAALSIVGVLAMSQAAVRLYRRVSAL